MAITAMGLGNKAAPEGANLDPQRQFWSWLEPFVNPDDKGADSGHHERGYFSGFACTQTDPAGMSIKIGGGSTADSALLVLTDGRCVLLSTNGEPEVVTIPTAPATGSRIDAVVSYIDTTSPTPETETPGTPEYVHTIVVRGTASSNPSAPTDSQIVGALPAGANSKYYRWCDVKVAAGQTVITNSNITDKKPALPNIYWTALAHYSSIGGSEVTITNSYVTLNSITIDQTGTYYVSAYVNPSMDGIVGGDAGIGLALNGLIGGSLSVYWSPPVSAWWYGSQNVTAIMSLNKGDVLGLQAIPRGGKQWRVNERRRLDAFRIA